MDPRLTVQLSRQAVTGGRRGKLRCNKTVRPRFVKDFHSALRPLFGWPAEEQNIAESPMEGTRPPVAGADQIRPLSQEQVSAIVAAAKQANHPLPERGPSTGAED